MLIRYDFINGSYDYETDPSLTRVVVADCLGRETDLTLEDIDYYADNIDDLENDHFDLYELVYEYVLEHFFEEAHYEYQEQVAYRNDPYGFYGIEEL